MLMATLIAHRGARALAAENTLVALELAAAQGATWVEIDVMLSADHIPVLSHDRIIQWLPTPVKVDQTSWAQLSQHQVKTPANSAYPNQPLASLEQASQLISRLNLGLNLEIKPATPALAAQTLELSLPLIAHLPPEKLVISSFNFAALHKAVELAPQIPRALLYEKLAPNWLDAVSRLQPKAIHLDHTWLTPEQVQQILAAGLEVYVYTVNQPQLAAKLFSWGVTGVFSDWPQLLQT